MSKPTQPGWHWVRMHQPSRTNDLPTKWIPGYVCTFQRKAFSVVIGGIEHMPDKVWRWGPRIEEPSE